MKIGFSLSPGGLMLPYHVGALAALEYNGFLDESSPLAGSSAGSIAVVSHACGIRPEAILEATIRVSDICSESGGARGRLLPLLKQQMNDLIDDDAFQRFCQRPGPTGVAFRQIFPTGVNYLQTSFQNKGDLIQATGFSCMFPFFATNWPCALDTSTTSTPLQRLPRLLVDGYFTVPQNRFGCPEFDMAQIQVDRTVAVAVFPSQVVDMGAFDDNDIISPNNCNIPLGDFFRIATQSTSRKDLTAVYEQGWMDAENWCIQEGKR